LPLANGHDVLQAPDLLAVLLELSATGHFTAGAGNVLAEPGHLALKAPTIGVNACLRQTAFHLVLSLRQPLILRLKRAAPDVGHIALGIHLVHMLHVLVFQWRQLLLGKVPLFRRHLSKVSLLWGVFNVVIAATAARHRQPPVIRVFGFQVRRGRLAL